jgi:haloalkane dehalogenase
MPQLPSGDRSLQNTRNARYCEIFVVTGGPLHLRGQVYNTLGCSDCPADLWNALDLEALKTQYNATAIILNGPRYFLMDRIAASEPQGVGNFGGLEMNLVATIQMSLTSVIADRLRGHQRKPYTEHMIDRSTQWFFAPGRTVYELVAPEGKVYVMQSYAHIVDDTLTEASLTTLAQRLRLPTGWQYRVRQVDTEYVIGTPGGEAHIVQDDFQNTYQRVDNSEQR